MCSRLALLALAALLGACTPPEPATDGTPTTGAVSPAAPADDLTAAAGPAPAGDPAPAVPAETPAEPTMAEDAVPGPAAGAEPAVVLHRTVCFGRCPSYAVSAYADGRVVYHGDRFVETTGTVERRVAPAVVAGLVASALEMEYETLPARLDNEQACPQIVTDAPTMTTTVRTTAWTWSVVHDGGCAGFARLAELTTFEREIDMALGTPALIGEP